MKDKVIIMAQLIYQNQNNRFINPPPLLWLSEISGALHLAEPGLTAGSPADKKLVDFEIFKTGRRSKNSNFRFV